MIVGAQLLIFGRERFVDRRGQIVAGHRLKAFAQRADDAGLLGGHGIARGGGFLFQPLGLAPRLDLAFDHAHQLHRHLDQHRRLDEHDHRMQQHAGQVGTVGEDPGRHEHIGAKMVHRDDRGTRNDCAPVAQHRQSGEQREEHHVHVHLQVAACGLIERDGRVDGQRRAQDDAHRGIDRAAPHQECRDQRDGHSHRDWGPAGPGIEADRGDDADAQPCDDDQRECATLADTC